MNSQYSGSLVGDDYSKNSMESHTEDDNSITTEERAWWRRTKQHHNWKQFWRGTRSLATLINDAASKVRDQYEDILQALLMEGHDKSEAKQEAFAQILPVFQKELADVYMNNLTWMKALKKDPIHKKIMPTRSAAVGVDKRKFLLKRLLEDQGHFPEEWIEKWLWQWKTRQESAWTLVIC